MSRKAADPRQREMLGEVAAALRSAGCAEAREGLLGKIKTAGFRVCDSSSYARHPVMVCTVRPARGYGTTGEEGAAAVLSDQSLLDQYSEALGQAGYPVHVSAGCVWVEEGSRGCSS